MEMMFCLKIVMIVVLLLVVELYFVIWQYNLEVFDSECKNDIVFDFLG